VKKCVNKKFGVQLVLRVKGHTHTYTHPSTHTHTYRDWGT